MSDTAGTMTGRFDISYGGPASVRLGPPGDYHGATKEEVREAVMAERERCAKLCEAQGAPQIAAAIRQGP